MFRVGDSSGGALWLARQSSDTVRRFLRTKRPDERLIYLCPIRVGAYRTATGHRLRLVSLWVVSVYPALVPEAFVALREFILVDVREELPRGVGKPNP